MLHVPKNPEYFLVFRCVSLWFVLFPCADTRNPSEPRRWVREADLLGEYVRSAHFEPPTRNVSPGRLQARANQFTSILYGTPEKTLLFLPNRTKLRFIDLSAQPPPLNECVSGNGGRLEVKPGSVWSCHGLLWQPGLPADKWSISPHVQVLRAYRCPGHINQFPTGGFVLGFALTVDISGPAMPDAIFFFWNLQERPRWVIRERKRSFFKKLMLNCCQDDLKFEVPRAWVESPLSAADGINRFHHLSAPPPG